ncbi:receptor-like protein 9DC1 [Solanum stenotomum]|uniref:receptor-like protein 9DC1 n=1 Tax=Solanum stenotomum TaxID=172797 RepID=UPI0020D01883|nr:receptor-like protein 9DC1 [Solanum stenotomum]
MGLLIEGTGTGTGIDQSSAEYARPGPYVIQLASCRVRAILHPCRKDQHAALLKFKKPLTLDPSLVTCSSYSYTSSWNRSRDCCSWDGVICDEMSGHMIELNLSSSGLVGKIDSNNSLFQLSRLQRLDLSSNNFSNSHILPELRRFLSLTLLDLSDSYFSGHIPSEISRLSQLQSLHFSPSFETILRLIAHDLKLLFENLTQLRELEGAIPQCLGNINGLEVLDMHHNSLSGTLPMTFTIGSALKSFNFYGNKLEEKSHNP